MEEKDETLPAIKPVNPHYIYNPETRKYDVLDLNTGKWVDAVKFEPTSTIYNLQMADTICDQIREGRTLQSICSEKEMPTTTRFYAWLSLYPELRVRYEQARKQRADRYHDKALEIALSMPNKDMVPGCKLAVDTLKWAAEKASPDYYGKKEDKVQGGPSVSITLNTGVLDTKAPTDIIIDEFGNFKGFKTEGDTDEQDSELQAREPSRPLGKDRWSGIREAEFTEVGGASEGRTEEGSEESKEG